MKSTEHEPEIDPAGVPVTPPPETDDPILEELPSISWEEQGREERAAVERELHELAAAGFLPEDYEEPEDAPQAGTSPE